MKDTKRIVKHNRCIFEGLLARIQNEKDLDNKVDLALLALDLATKYPTEYYSSQIIENVFCEVARSINIQLCEEIQSNSCLVVMSTAYEVGGHTRVVERWIEADTATTYSLVLTRPTSCLIPIRLKDDIERSGGTVLNFESDCNWKETALSLRKVASRFEKVLLFTHMNDYIPIVAFGTDAFNRPVGFYNHADHLFSLGVSISDSWGELRKWGQMVTANYRGNTSSSIISVPFETQKILNKDNAEIRERLGVPKKAKVVMTVGGTRKLSPSSFGDLSKIFVPILLSDINVIYYIIGTKESEIDSWIKYKQQFGDRLLFVPPVPHSQLLDYFCAADLVIDSCPLSGITSLQDAVLCHCPVLSRTDRIDWLTSETGYCESDSILVQKAKHLLDSAEERKMLWSKVLNAIKDECGLAIFRERIISFMNLLTLQKHKVQQFECNPTGCISMDLKLAESVQRDMLVYRKALLRQIRPYWFGDMLYRSFLIYLKCRYSI